MIYNRGDDVCHADIRIVQHQHTAGETAGRDPIDPRHITACGFELLLDPGRTVKSCYFEACSARYTGVYHCEML